MPRRRMIDPHFWESGDVAKLSVLARLVFIGMFSKADDAGRGVGRSVFLRNTIFPYDDIPINQIEEALNEIKSFLSVTFYEVDGIEYYQFNNWEKWQRVDKPQPSNLPPNPEKTQEKCGSSDSKNHSKNDSENGSRLKEKKGKEDKRREKNTPPKSPKGDGTGVEMKKEEERSAQDESLTVEMARGSGNEKPVAHSKTLLQERFDRFWNAYPRKVGKVDARKAWDKLKPDDSLLSDMLKAIEAAKHSEQWQKEEGKFIPHPATWLRGGRWEDEFPLPPENTQMPEEEPREIPPDILKEEARHAEAMERFMRGECDVWDLVPP